MTRKTPSLFDLNIVGPAFGEAFRKLDPRLMIKNPVMFVTMAGANANHLCIFDWGSNSFRPHMAQLVFEKEGTNGTTAVERAGHRWAGWRRKILVVPSLVRPEFTER
jgi:hypothetical protein